MGNKVLFGMRKAKSSNVSVGDTSEGQKHTESVEEIADRLVIELEKFSDRIKNEYQQGNAAFESKLEMLKNDTMEKSSRINKKIQEVQRQISELENEADNVGKAYAKAIVSGAADLKSMEERQFTISSQITTYKSLLKNLQETIVPGDKEIMKEVMQSYKELYERSISLREVRKSVYTSLNDVSEKIQSKLKSVAFDSNMFLVGSFEMDKLVRAYESVYGKIKVSEDGNYGGAGTADEAKRRYVHNLAK